jgi:DNA-binding FadR family transcriptional regulator
MGPILESAAPAIRQRYEQVADHLIAEIRQGRLPAGTRLPGERDLAQRFGVGRASVREALGALQVRGVVETRPGAGSFVAVDARERLSAKDAGGVALPDLPADASPSALLEARRILEPGIAGLAARRAGRDPDLDRLLDVMAGSCDAADPEQRRRWSEADRSFHRQIAAGTGNPVLMAVADQIAALMDQPLWLRLRDDAIAVPGRTTIQVAEHRMIAEAIAEGDPEAAEFHAAQHLDRGRRSMALD